MIKFFKYLQLVNEDKVLKKIILISIFLSFFALIFSGTAIRYSILNDKKYLEINEIKKHQVKIQKVSYKILNNKFNLIREERNSLNYFLTETKTNLNDQIDDVKLNYCSYMKQAILISVLKTKGIMALGNQYLTKAWKTDHLIEKHNINHLNKSIKELSDLFSNKKVNFCKDKALSDVRALLTEQILLQDKLLFIVKDLKLISVDRLDKAFKELNLNYNNSNNFILTAFFLQLIIFLVLNFVDIRSVFLTGLRK